eukprot:SAG31_NODE_3706_length_3971_cov_7.584969_4_plen_66_part_00
MVQAYTARRAEQSTNEQAHEQHIAEQTRQREHEQMTEQISRINRSAAAVPHERARTKAYAARVAR